MPKSDHDLKVKEERARRMAIRRAMEESQDYQDLFEEFFEQEKALIAFGKHDETRRSGPEKGYAIRRRVARGF